MIEKFINSLYTKVFINIIVQGTTSIVYVEVCSNENVIDSSEMTFETTSINVKMYEFIDEYIKSSPYYYISILDKSSSQGATPTCDDEKMKLLEDIDSFKKVCFYQQWASYTSEDELSLMESEYKSIGFDFIFSPFIVLAKFFQDKIDSDLAMFVLVEEDRIALAVFEKSKLLYADYIDINQDNSDDELLIDTSDDDDPLADLDGIEEIDLDDLGGAEEDDFGDIEDLDSSDDIEEFAQAQDIEEITNEGEE